MSYATMFLTIIFIINLGLFLYSWGNPMGCQNCSPMLNIISQFMGTGGSFDMGWFLSEGAGIILSAAIIAVGIRVVSTVLGGGIASPLTGVSSQANPLVVIAIAVLFLFIAIPNFSSFGFPEPLGFLITMIFGFMGMMAVFGLLRGE